MEIRIQDCYGEEGFGIFGKVKACNSEAIVKHEKGRCSIGKASSWQSINWAKPMLHPSCPIDVDSIG